MVNAGPSKQTQTAPRWISASVSRKNAKGMAPRWVIECVDGFINREFIIKPWPLVHEGSLQRHEGRVGGGGWATSMRSMSTVISPIVHKVIQLSVNLT